MKSVVVRYEVSPEYAEQNATNIRAVMEDLQALADPSIRYQAFRCIDNPSRFTHIGFYADEASLQRMTSLDSFKRFQTQLKESRPVSPPDARWLDLVGSSRPLFD